MTKREFKDLVQNMIDTYGVRSYINNLEEDMSEEEIDEDLWFECPECGEPILFEDYGEELEIGDSFICPVCEEELEL